MIFRNDKIFKNNLVLQYSAKLIYPVMAYNRINGFCYNTPLSVAYPAITYMHDWTRLGGPVNTGYSGSYYHVTAHASRKLK